MRSLRLRVNPTPRSRRPLLAAAAAGAVLLGGLVGCGSGGSTATQDTPSATASASPAGGSGPAIGTAVAPASPTRPPSASPQRTRAPRT
ncbi:hypothetical protein K7862_34200, partial [Streptomyces sp. PLK6-54]|nr:hypothetical protein [Streptomyces acidipaludis]